MPRQRRVRWAQRNRADGCVYDRPRSFRGRAPKGVFAGISLDGATLRNDIDENQVMYGQRWTIKDIVGSGAKMPDAASKLIAELNKYSPRGKK